MTMEPTRKILDDEIEAIELGLNGLAYGLRRTYMIALDTMSIKRSVRPGSDSEKILGPIPARNLAVLQSARRKIGDLMEEVGDYRNDTDCCTDREASVTADAYGLMQELADRDRAQETPEPREDEPTPAQAGG